MVLHLFVCTAHRITAIKAADDVQLAGSCTFVYAVCEHLRSQQCDYRSFDLHGPAWSCMVLHLFEETTHTDESSREDVDHGLLTVTDSN